MSRCEQVCFTVMHIRPHIHGNNMYRYCHEIIMDFDPHYIHVHVHVYVVWYLPSLSSMVYSHLTFVTNESGKGSVNVEFYLHSNKPSTKYT